MKERGTALLRWSFMIGTIADSLVALNWFLIAGGYAIPNYLNGHTGTGDEYRLAMYIAGLFMAGWGIILFWGWFKPQERKGLLVITSGMLLVSIIVEILFYPGMLTGSGFTLGVLARIALITKFMSSVLYSRPGDHVTAGC